MDPEELAHLVLQLAVLLLAAKLIGLVFKKFKQSEVLGELIGGMAVGPFALGAVKLPWIGQLFPAIEQVGEHASTLPISNELYFFGQIGAIILLFLVGLETDAKMFMKYGLKSLGIAIGGVVVPFFLGAWGTIMFGFADSIMDTSALFMGAIMVATSVGITARVLSDMYKLDTQEGVSILAAAVIDDVLGILVLAFVLSIAGGGESAGTGISWGELGTIGLKALGFLGGVSLLGFFFSKKLSALLLKLDGKSYMAIAAAICFMIAALAEMFGLAMIIGAYLVGILLSVTKIGDELEEKLAGASHLIVPIFFAIMGTLVDFKAMGSVLAFGLVISAFAIIGKVIGAGIPAYFSGFNFLGSSRIGIGMLPRGEVALIVAGIGLSAGIISSEIFGVSIMMTVITTLMAPIILVPLFKNPKPGLKHAPEVVPVEIIEPYKTLRQSPHMLTAIRDYLVEAFTGSGYVVLQDDRLRGIVEIKHADNESKLLTIKQAKGEMTIDCSGEASTDVDTVVSQALAHFEQAVADLKSA
ncbi:MAG: cation:proton antiporter [Patescibacteria group bacterium]